MTDYPRPCEKCGTDGLWSSDNRWHRALCPNCLAAFEANQTRQAQEEAEFTAYSKSHGRIYSSIESRDNAKAAWLRRRT